VAAGVVGEFGEQLWLYRVVSSPLWRTYKLWGFEGMMTMIATEPDLVRHACERFVALELANIREAAEHGTAGIWIEECLTDMIGPRAYAELNMPYLKRLIEAIREAGMKSIYYYCGDPARNWDVILSMGMDALGMEESKKGFNTEIDDIVDRVAGRCVVLGNLDAFNVLQNGSDEQLRAAIQHQLDAGRRNGGRFIMSLGSPVTPATPVSRVRRYCDLVRELTA
jgi:uroporphyrinogen-III decarboxylase